MIYCPISLSFFLALKRNLILLRTNWWTTCIITGQNTLLSVGPTAHLLCMRKACVTCLPTLCKTACSLLVKLPMSRPALAFTRPWKQEQELLVKFVELLNTFRRSSNRRGPKWNIFGFVNLVWIKYIFGSKNKIDMGEGFLVDILVRTLLQYSWSGSYKSHR